MSTKLRDSFRRRGPVPKILIAGAALSAVGLIGAGAASAAGAATTSGHAVTTNHAVTTKAEPTGPDTDNIQSGDQTTPDATSVSTVSKVDKATAGDKSDTTESTTGKDTDNIQSGDQTGPDTGTGTGTGTGQNR